MGLIVQKFGGTSVGSIERIKHVAQLIKGEVEAGNKVAVVVSAMGKSTDELIDMAYQLTAKPSPREMDMLLTTGEQVSIALLSMALTEVGLKAISFTGWQAGIETEAIHQKARITHIDPSKLTPYLNEGYVTVVAGFQGVTPDGQITTLGRGGSDTTAVALAAALGADRCDIFTDVRGIYTADPRVVPSASQLSEISYDEMLELATLGAGVLHPRAVECAKKYGVPLMVRSSFENVPGTVVKEETLMETGRVVHGVAHDDRVSKVTVKGLPNEVGILSRLFNLLADHNLNVDIIINQSIKGDAKTNISFSIDTQDLDQALDVLNQHQDYLGFEQIIHEGDMAKVSIVGAGMISNPGVAAKMFQTLAEAGIDIKMVSTSEIKVSCVVPRKDMVKAVQSLHTAFGLDRVEDKISASN